MSDDVQATEGAALTPEEQRKADLRAKRMANLLPPIKPGESRNKSGSNGRTQHAALVRWLEEKSNDGTLTRIERVWQASYLAALKGAAIDRRTLIEQHGGKPREVESAKIVIPVGCDTSRSLLDIVADVYRARLVDGQMGESEFAEMARLMLSVDQVKLALLLKLLGKDTSGKTPDQVLAMLNSEPAKISTEPAPGEPDGVSPPSSDPVSDGAGSAELPAPSGPSEGGM